MDNSEDSIDAWTLTPDGHVRITGKSRANRKAFAVLLLFFRAKRAVFRGGRNPSICRGPGGASDRYLTRLGKAGPPNATELRFAYHSAFASRCYESSMNGTTEFLAKSLSNSQARSFAFERRSAGTRGRKIAPQKSRKIISQITPEKN